MEWRRALANWTKYPLSLSEYERAYRPGYETNCDFVGLRERLDRGERIKISVLGGSVTAGTHCINLQGDVMARCAYPIRVEAWFKRHMPHWNLVIRNRARGGYGTVQWSSEINIDTSDAYLLEFMINPSDKQSTMNLIETLTGPKLIVALSRSCPANYASCLRECKNGTVIRIPVHVAGPRLASQECAPGETYACNHFWDVVEAHDYLLPRHSMAMYRDLLWLNRTHLLHPADFPHIWNGRTHPTSDGQDFIAHFVTYSLLREFYAPVKACSIRALRKPRCEHPQTHYDAFHSQKLRKVPMLARGWEFFEDRPNKPGWIATNFTFAINTTGTVEITFLQSYENVETVRVYFPGCGQEYVELSPHINLQVSLSKVARYSQGVVPNHIQVPCLDVSQVNAPLTFQATKGKFKVIRILGC